MGLCSCQSSGKARNLGEAASPLGEPDSFFHTGNMSGVPVCAKHGAGCLAIGGEQIKAPACWGFTVSEGSHILLATAKFAV